MNSIRPLLCCLACRLDQPVAAKIIARSILCLPDQRPAPGFSFACLRTYERQPRRASGLLHTIYPRAKGRVPLPVTQLAERLGISDLRTS